MEMINKEEALRELRLWIEKGECRSALATFYIRRRLVGLDATKVTTAHWTNGLGKVLKMDADGVPEVGFNDDGAWCSNCKEKLIGSKVYDTIGRYCPNCGAKMEVGNEDS